MAIGGDGEKGGAANGASMGLRYVTVETGRGIYSEAYRRFLGHFPARGAGAPGGAMRVVSANPFLLIGGIRVSVSVSVSCVCLCLCLLSVVCLSSPSPSLSLLYLSVRLSVSFLVR